MTGYTRCANWVRGPTWGYSLGLPLWCATIVCDRTGQSPSRVQVHCLSPLRNCIKRTKSEGWLSRRYTPWSRNVRDRSRSPRCHLGITASLFSQWSFLQWNRFRQSRNQSVRRRPRRKKTYNLHLNPRLRNQVWHNLRRKRYSETSGTATSRLCIIQWGRWHTSPKALYPALELLSTWIASQTST